MADDRTRFTQLVRERAYKEGTFTLASGRTSSYYVNGKMVTLHPEGLALASRLVLQMLKPEVQAVGGLTMGADPVVGGVVALSWGTSQPIAGFMVRKEPKGHGTQSLIEGPLKPGQAVCIIEDTTTTGGSLLKAVRAAEEAGAKVVQCITLVDRQEGGSEALEDAGFTLERIITLTDLRSGAFEAA